MMSAKSGGMIEKLLKEIQHVVEDLKTHQDEVLEKKDPSIDQKVIFKRLAKLEDLVHFIQEFNHRFFKTVGLTDKDLRQAMANRQKNSGLDEFLKTSEKLKGDILLSYANFLKSSADHAMKNPAFVPQKDKKPRTSKGVKPKGGYKQMVQGQKWKKM